MPAPKIAGTIRSKNPLKGAVEILPERLYYAALKSPPPSHNILATTPKRANAAKDPAGHNNAATEGGDAAAAAGVKKEKKQIHFFNIDNELVYWNFFLDFGPLNLGQLMRFCHKLNEKLRKFPVVCYYSNTVPAKRANAVFLICAWQILFLKRSPEQAHTGFVQGLAQLEAAQQKRKGNNAGAAADAEDFALEEDTSWPPVSESQGAATIQALPPFHDASPVACTYDLSVIDCLEGMVRARQHGFFDPDNFDVEEYEHYEQVENGDLNWIAAGKIMAFAGPSYERHVSPEGYCTLAPADYIPYFRKRKVDLVVRLNKKNYNESDFERAGIRHVEKFFLDGSCPSMKILREVLDSFESVPEGKGFAVHCKAGLGRTGTCIGAYLMKNFRWTAAESIGWMRVCRPGCVIGPQQHFLQQIENRMWQENDFLKSPRQLSPRAAAANKSPRKPANTLASRQKQQHPTKSDLEEAVVGRSGQADGLLAARGRRSKSEIKAAIPTPPITPEQMDKSSIVMDEDESSVGDAGAMAVVTPDGESSGRGGGW